ncbi:cannabinoid receptor 1-like [Lingula anatina]|uniref:Cannabinoid receptor 1-like n=1 Tax=Lingula anatina TaxID=7574 RepID=A0A1S3IWA6_LINAN|nr:cannabinoid receptor 1-like [Lingula anatina]|eukprot:XP_013402246.1 cannabinoid receptor 1-like [Lingula anatina]
MDGTEEALPALALRVPSQRTGFYNMSTSIGNTEGLGNDTLFVNYYSGSVFLTYTAVAGLITSIGLLQNALSLLALKHMRRPMNSFQKLIINLAFADFLLMFFCCAVCAIRLYLGVGYVNYATMPPETRSISCIEQIVMDISIHLLVPPLLATTGLVLNQFVAATRPLRFTNIVTERRIRCYIAFTYVSAVVPLVILHAVYYIIYPNADCITHMDKYFVALEGHVGIFMMLLMVLNVFIWYKLYTKIKESLSYRHDLASDPQDHEQAKLNVTVAILLVTIFVCWVPGVVTAFIYFGFDVSHTKRPESSDAVAMVTNILFIFNSLADPIIYGLRIRDVRHGYVRLYQRISDIFCSSGRLAKADSRHHISCNHNHNTGTPV